MYTTLQLSGFVMLTGALTAFFVGLVMRWAWNKDLEEHRAMHFRLEETSHKAFSDLLNDTKKRYEWTIEQLKRSRPSDDDRLTWAKEREQKAVEELSQVKEAYAAKAKEVMLLEIQLDFMRKYEEKRLHDMWEKKQSEAST